MKSTFLESAFFIIIE